MECATKDAQIDEEIKVSNGTPPSTFKVLIPLYFLLNSLTIQRAVKQKRNENFNLSKVHWGGTSRVASVLTTLSEFRLDN